MKQRIARATLLRLASHFPIIGITGPRQSGKTTLAKMTFPDKTYITLDDKNLRELAESNPSDFVAAFLKLLPLSINELKDADMLPNNAYDFIYNGQYPPFAAGKSGHSDVKTTVTYTYILNKCPAGVTSPLDKL
jgi:ABC-type cobalamin/Fe3+-siderophores transport system ATPase subunit